VKRLLIRPGAIGDLILSLPALEAARGEYTEVWAPRPALPLIRFADRVRAIADTGLDLVGVVEDASTAALEGFDSIYSWYGYHRPEFRDAVRRMPFTFFPALPPPEGVPHIPVPPAPRSDFAVIHPFASGRHKRWALENFHTVAERLGVPVRWCAGPEDQLDGAQRFDNLYDLAGWLATARLYIGNDSGIGHLAAAVGVPVVAIFLATDPAVWAPRGDHVTVLQNPSIEDVVTAAVHRLGGRLDGRLGGRLR
jgi:heptosyltransferase III